MPTGSPEESLFETIIAPEDFLRHRKRR